MIYKKQITLILSLYISFNASALAPQIKNMKWGEIIISQNSAEKIYRDARIFPTRSESWDWRKTGTAHNPGIQIADIEDIVSQSDIVILTRGVDLVLQVPQETIDYVKSKGRDCRVGQTVEMVALYNKLVNEGKKVGGVFHTTC